MKVGIRCAPMALLAIFAWSFSLSAQQTKSFLPVLAGTEAMDLGLALSNSSALDATVNLTARDYSGSLITGAGITNPTTIVVPRNGQRAMRTVEMFGSDMANKTGWVELTADAAIKGFFLLFDSRVSFIDGTDLQSTPSRQLIFQRV